MNLLLEYQKEAEDIVKAYTILQQINGKQLEELNLDYTYGNFTSTLEEHKEGKILFSEHDSQYRVSYNRNGSCDIHFNPKYGGFEVLWYGQDNNLIRHDAEDLLQKNFTEEELFQQSLIDDKYIINRAVVIYKYLIDNKQYLPKDGLYIYYSLFLEVKDKILGAI